MAIVPLDLQVLYSQLETVSKRVAHEQQGTQEAHAQQMAEKNSTVQQLQSGEDGIQKVKDRASGGSSQGGSRKKQQEEEPQEQAPEHIAFQDPNLGKYIDISG